MTLRRNPLLVLLELLALVAALSAVGLSLAEGAEARAVTAGKLAELRVRPADSVSGYDREKFPAGATRGTPA